MVGSNLSDLETRSGTEGMYGCVTCNDSTTSGGNISGGIPIQPYSFPHLVATSIILGTIILATIIGNVFVIAAVILERNLHVNVANFLITSLAVADLMVAALVMPLAAVNEVSRQWFLGSEICDMWISFDVLCCTSSILHLVAISIDRYWAVTQVDYIRNRPAKRILGMIAASWFISVTISIPPLFGWKDPNDPSETGVCLISQDWGYTVFSTLGAFYLPLMAMVIIYIKVFQAARSRIRKKAFRNGGGKNNKKGATHKPLLHSNHDSVSTTVNGCGGGGGGGVSHSPEPSSNGSAGGGLHLQDDANRNNKLPALTPPGSPQFRDPNNKKAGSFLDITKLYFKGSSPKKKEKEKSEKELQKEKLEQKRERKAARTLGIITGAFVVCWLPFFILAVVMPFCGENCHCPPVLSSVIAWLGYLNSLLNPIIYTIFSPDFRMAFRKILFGKYHSRYSVRR